MRKVDNGVLRIFTRGVGIVEEIRKSPEGGSIPPPHERESKAGCMHHNADIFNITFPL